MMMGQHGMEGHHGQPGSGMGPGGMMMGAGSPGMMGWGGPRMMGAMEPWEGSRYDRPLISILLRQREMFRLTSEQEQKLRTLRADYDKDAARGGADIRVAEVDLREMLAADAPDLSKVEAQVKKIAALQGELRFRRIQTLQAGLALLTKEQRQQFDRHLHQMGMMGMMGGGMGPGMMRPPGPGMGPRQPAPPPRGSGPEPQR
jgi:Spy/CpxP family protein refolding chaperone